MLITYSVFFFYFIGCWYYNSVVTGKSNSPIGTMMVINLEQVTLKTKYKKKKFKCDPLVVNFKTEDKS